MNGQGDFAATLTGWAHQAGEIALGWLSSPAAWSQFGLLAVAYLVARLATARVAPIVIRLDGTNADAGRQILLDAGIPASKLISKPTMLEAARAAVDIANARVA